MLRSELEICYENYFCTTTQYFACVKVVLHHSLDFSFGCLTVLGPLISEGTYYMMCTWCVLQDLESPYCAYCVSPFYLQNGYTLRGL